MKKNRSRTKPFGALELPKFSKLLRLFCLFGLLITVSCTREKPKFTTPGQQKKVAKTEGSLSLNKATLEQSDSKGKPLWKIAFTSSVYSLDNKKVVVKNVQGNFFQDGKMVLQISADEGEVHRDGKEIELRKNIVAVDPRNKVTISGNVMKWQPSQGLMTLTKGFGAAHNDLQISAQKAYYRTKDQVLEIFDKIVGLASNSQFEFKTDYLKWLVAQHKIINDHPTEFVKYKDNLITDQLNSKKMEIDLQQNTVLSRETVNFKSTSPTVQVIGNNFTWNYKNRYLFSKEPTQFTDYKEYVTMTANQSYFDQNKQYVTFKGQLHAQSSRNKTQLSAQEGVWHLDTKQIDASGNVIYDQTNPEFHTNGDRAVGFLQTNNVVVTTNAGSKVVTKFYPEKKK